MSFLPIVERELRAGSRRKSTYRLRWWTALLAIVACLCWLIIVGVVSPRGNLGKALFTVLTGYIFFLCALAGIFLTADCLSEEKREGTLGLLFLTDLKGYDVVLGKFAARSINAFYALLALLPLTGLPLLVGGVTGAEFWRMMLALVNALFFSLALGTCVSAFSRAAHNAMGATLVAVVLIFGGVAALAALPQPWPKLAAFSPLSPFLYAVEPLYPIQPARFWRSLAFSHGLAWLFGFIPAFTVSRIFHDRPPRATGAVRRQRVLLEQNPIYWLTGTAPGLRRLVWALVSVWAIVMFGEVYLAPKGVMWNFQSAKVCAFLLKVLVAAQACRFFVEARQSGALELLLCTPLRNVEILRGQWLALRKSFLWPVIVFLLLNLVPVAFGICRSVSTQARPERLQAILHATQGFLAMGWLGLSLIADTFAVAWVGMRIALTGKNPKHAFSRTVLCVLLIPCVGICGLDMVADLFFILWAATSLHQDFRILIGPQFQRVQVQFLSPATSQPKPPILANG